MGATVRSPDSISLRDPPPPQCTWHTLACLALSPQLAGCTSPGSTREGLRGQCVLKRGGKYVEPPLSILGGQQGGRSRMKALSLGSNVGVPREVFLEQEPRSSPSHLAQQGSKPLGLV